VLLLLHVVIAIIPIPNPNCRNRAGLVISTPLRGSQIASRFRAIRAAVAAPEAMSRNALDRR
jgi:hypothetical protein